MSYYIYSKRRNWPNNQVDKIKKNRHVNDLLKPNPSPPSSQIGLQTMVSWSEDILGSPMKLVEAKDADIVFVVEEVEMHN